AAAPASEPGPARATLAYDTGGKDGKGKAEITLDPGRSGDNTLALELTDALGYPADVPEVKVAFTLAAKDIGPLDVGLKHVDGGATGHALTADDPAPALGTLGAHAVPFHGRHQAGITTPLQARGHLAAFDLAAGTGRAEAAALMRRWTRSAAAMAVGRAAAD